MGDILDRFSDIAEGYARYRPKYPDALFDVVFSHVSHRRNAWDVGTGNGQVAHILANTFETVIATDISRTQINEAIEERNITYRVCPAEQSGIPSATIDLTTVAQAAHWFDLDAFAKEVQRVSAEHAILGIWGYHLIQTRPDVDALIQYLYRDILDGFWDPQRTMIDRHYRDIAMPFEECPCPDFQMQNTYDADALLGYLRTWSAVRKYVVQHGRDPVGIIEADVRKAFGTHQILCTTPLFLRLWKI